MKAQGTLDLTINAYKRARDPKDSQAETHRVLWLTTNASALRTGQRGYPGPVGLDGLLSPVELPADRASFQALHHPDRPADLRPACKSLQIPAVRQPAASRYLYRRLAGKEALGIAPQVPCLLYLRAVTRLDGSLQASVATAEIRRVRLVAVQNRGHQAMSRRANRLAPLEPGIYLPGYQADAVGIDIGADPADRISDSQSRRFRAYRRMRRRIISPAARAPSANGCARLLP